MSATTLQRTPLNAWHRAHGGRMVDFGGWEMPVQYAPGILKEHLATRRQAGLFDVSHMGRFRIAGFEALGFLQYVLSNNAAALRPGFSQYTMIPNEAGGLLDDAYLYRFAAAEYTLVVNAANRQKDWAHLQEHAGRFSEIELEDRTDSIAMIAFQGPLSRRILAESLERGCLPDPAHNRLSEAAIRGTPLRLARTGYTGEPVGFELFVPAEKAEEIWSLLFEIGAPAGILPIGLGARDTLRLEAGMPLYGHEFGTDPDGREIPAFAFPLTKIAVSFAEAKGEFVGRAALLEQFRQTQKIQAGTYEPTECLRRRILPLAVLDRGVVRQGNEVFVADRKVGVVTSGTTVPYWEFEGEGATMRITDRTARRAIALAYVDAELQPEQRVEAEVRKKRLAAQIVRWHGRSEAPPYFRAIPVDYARAVPDLAAGATLGQVEALVKRSVENHAWRQKRCVNLIPSEMTPSPLVRLLQISDPVGRYAEHKELLAAFEQEVFYYQGTDFIEWVENRVAEEMAAFLGCGLIEARAVSGQMANMTVFSAITDYRNRIDRRRESERIRLVVNNHIGKGGHLSSQPMGALRDYVAKDPLTERYAVLNFPVCAENPYRIDLPQTAELLADVEPELVIFGKSMVLHPEPVAQVKALLAEKTRPPVIMYDMAHVLGLVGPHFQQPFEDGADIVTGSTHKTFFGTQRGIIGANLAEDRPEFDLWKAIRRRTFPGMVSNHHLGTLLGLLMAAIEMNAFKDMYQPRVLANAKAFAKALHSEGLDVEGDPDVDYTETHQVIVNVGYARGCEVAEQLEHSNIIVNYQAIPSDESFTASSGLRLGVSEMTRFGMKEKDFLRFAPLFARAVRGEDVGSEVAAFRDEFQTMHFCFDADVDPALKAQLLATLDG